MSWKLNSSDFISDQIALGVSKQKSIERLAARVCWEIMARCLSNEKTVYSETERCPLGWGPGAQELIPQLLLHGPLIAGSPQHKEHHPIWLHWWSETAEPRHDALHGVFRQSLIRSTAYSESFITQDFIAGATVFVRDVYVLHSRAVQMQTYSSHHTCGASDAEPAPW